MWWIRDYAKDPWLQIQPSASLSFTKNDKGADQHLRRFSVNDGGADSPLASSSFTERRQGSEGVNIYRVDPSRG